MVIKLEVLDAEEAARLEASGLAEAEALRRRAPNRHQVHCPCGRFAKWAGDRHYYNGRFDCYSYDVICSRCGTVTVECV